ncbi:MAG: filamentous hemagglutinin N-terminal domain-containing protein [Gammaproteobacteria bacterium]|nr:filamentous hemagglutinin N-terminal domain-containing protein [Gammaproteobacteria bacterium]
MHGTLNRRCRRHGALSWFACGVLASGVAAANPNGANVVHGQVSFANPDARTLEITNSPSAIINWRGFDIGAGETTRFIQQSAASAVLNRVTAGNSSEILGNLVSNGRVFLINPSGILIGRDAKVDTAGLVLSTLGIRDEDFLQGRLHFEGDGNELVNHGYIKTGPGGEVVLIAPRIVNEAQAGNDNSGLIESPGGELVLAAGRSITLASLDHPDITFEVRAPEDEVVNLGRLLAEGGSVGVFAGSIHQGGRISADAVTRDSAGRVVLAASTTAYLDDGSATTASGAGQAGAVEVRASNAAGEGRVYALGKVAADGDQGGTVSVTADRALLGGKLSAHGVGSGGAVEVATTVETLATSGARLDASADSGPGGRVRVDAGDNLFSSATMTATGSAGGRVEVFGDEITLAAANIDASGASGGGTVRVGGGFRGGEGLPTAKRTVVNANTVIKADAVSAGNGGSIVAWADDTIEFAGLASARGGAANGNGGTIEISGKNGYQLTSAPDVSAPSTHGEAGTVIFDPKNIVFTEQDNAGGSLSLLDPHPGENNAFGQNVQFLYENGDFSTPAKYLVFDYLDDFGGVDAGAVYLFDATDGALLTTLTGSHAGDMVGNGLNLSSVAGINYLRSYNWNSDAGALTPFDPIAGLNGVVGATNSLVGANPGDLVGNSSVQTLGTMIGVRSPSFNGDRGAITILAPGAFKGTVGTGISLVGANTGDLLGSNFISGVSGSSTNYYVANNHGGAGAVTFFNVNSAPKGLVSATNSLVGTTATDAVGSGGVQHLGSGVYAVRSPSWDGAGTDRGAVTFIDGINLRFAGTATAARGTVAAANSLVGATDLDAVGSAGLSFVSSNLYGVRSPDFDNGGATNAGALTWYTVGNALSGVVSGSNSLLGGFANDAVGGFANSFQFLSGGKLLYMVPGFNGNAGAVAFIDPLAPVTGTLSASTALIGPAPGDQLGSGGIQAVGSYYIVLSPDLQGGVGAVTIASTATGVTGMADGTNSLVGAAMGDRIGDGGLLNLGNGNAVVFSPGFNGSAGAATYLDLNADKIFGEAGFNAVVNSNNSLVGTNPGDGFAPNGIFDADLFNGHYVIVSPDFEAGNQIGAVTVVDVDTGEAGLIGAGNSLIGNPGDRVGSGGLLFLNNGNIVVQSPEWGGTAGAVTYIDLTFGHILNEGGFGAFANSSNSLVGAQGGDGVGSDGVEEISVAGGTYYAVYSSTVFNSNASASNAGAVTFVDSDLGLAGTVDDTNSLVGTNDDDFIGLGMNREILDNGNVVLINPQWNTDTGAVTFVDLVNGAGMVGSIDGTSATISLFGDSSGDQIGLDGVEQFSAGVNQYYAVFSSRNDNGGATDAGAVTFADINSGVQGPLSNLNSFVGTNTNDRVGSFGDYQQLSNGNLLLLNELWNNNAGAVTFVNLNAGTGLAGDIDGTNSVVGNVGGDRVGSNGIYQVFGTNTFAILSPHVENAGQPDAGAITWGNVTTGVTGPVNSTNSLRGVTNGDLVGQSCCNFLSGSQFYVESQQFDNDKGALTFFDGTGTLPVGPISASNSLLGSTAFDDLGSGGIYTTSTPGGTWVVIESPLWDNGANTNAGAITTFLLGTPKVGVVSASNSLVGSHTNDRVGGGFLRFLSNGNRLLVTDTWNSNAGAVTFWNTSSDLVGTVGPSNSLVGGNAGDRVGDWDVTETSNDRYYVASPDWNGGMGAVTFGSIATGAKGTVSAANSLVGSTAGDRVGQDIVDLYYVDRLLMLSETWNGSRGAVTVLDSAAPLVGAVSSSNSLVGSTAGDQVGAIAQQLFNTDNQGLVVLRTTSWNNDAGAVTVFDPLNPIKGTVSASNSLVGRPGDFVGLNGVSEFGNGNLIVRSTEWSDGTGEAFGAVTIMVGDGAPVTPVTGFVSSTNSLVGSHLDDRVGNGGTFTLASGNILVRSPNWFEDRGAVTFVDMSMGLTGVISPVNSLAGELPSDLIGSGGISSLGGERALVRSPNASVDGILGAGRIDIISSTADFGIGGDVGFGANPDAEQSVSIASVIDILNSGATLVLQANNDILLPLGLDIVANQGTLRLEAGRSIDIKGNLVVTNGILSLLANAPGGDAAFRDAGDGNILLQAGDTGIRLLASTIELEAQNILLEGGTTAAAHVAVIGLDSTTVHAHGSGLLELRGGTAAGATPPGADSDVIDLFVTTPVTVNAPMAVLAGRNSLSVTADDIALYGGGDGGAAALIGGTVNLDALTLDLQGGSGASSYAAVSGTSVDVSADTSINLLGGDGTAAHVAVNGGPVNLASTSLALSGGAGTDAYAAVSGTAVKLLAEDIALTGGSGGGAYVAISGDDVDVDPPRVTLQGGSGSGAYAEISGTNTVAVLAGQLTLAGGSGANAHASINGGSIVVDAAHVGLQGGSGTGAYAALRGTAVDVTAEQLVLRGGSAAVTHASIVGLDHAVLNVSGLLAVHAGSAAGAPLVPDFGLEIVDRFLGDPSAIEAPIALVFGFRGLDVMAHDIAISGGGSEGAFAALASFGDFVVATENLAFEPGAGLNADALLLGLGGLGDIDYTSCTGCKELYFDPLIDPVAQSGTFIQGRLQEPTVDAILAMLERSSDQGGEGEGDDDDDDDEDDAAECE